MQAIILAAGKGTRMGHLTENVPKPLLMFGGKTLLAHKLERLPRIIGEVIIVNVRKRSKRDESVTKKWGRPQRASDPPETPVTDRASRQGVPSQKE